MTHIIGFDFLILYGTSLLAVLGLTFLLKRFWDNSLTYGIKSVTDFDPCQVAYLRGGAKEVIGVGLVGLLNKEGIEKQDEKLVANYAVKTDGIEAILQGNLSNPRSTQQIYRDRHILDRAERLCQTYEYELMREKLIFSENTRKIFKTLRYFYYAFFLGIGGFRLFMGLTNGKPVLYLVGLMIFAVISIWFVTKIPRLTRRGERYLEDLASSYKQKLRDFSEQEKSKKQNQETDENPSYAHREDTVALAGLFGVVALADHSSEYSLIAAEQKRQVDLSSSGYGGGDSGSSGGDGGGSSCGGGGCGGCGGGGCGGGG